MRPKMLTLTMLLIANVSFPITGNMNRKMPVSNEQLVYGNSSEDGLGTGGITWPDKPVTPVVPTPATPVIPTYYVFQSDMSAYFQRQYTRLYFENLTENFPINGQYDCGYIAICMYLSFLDTYWNDSFIPEQYEMKGTLTSLNDFTETVSPGIRHDIELEKKSKSQELYDALIAKQDTFLLGKLFQLATPKVITPDNVSLGVNYGKMCDILDAYLDSQSSLKNVSRFSRYYGGLGPDYCPSEYVNDASIIRNEIIEKLRNGQPVICGGSTINGGHVAVASYYDEEKDAIFGHSGWVGDKADRIIDFDHKLFTSINDYYCFDIPSSMHHNHSKHYQLDGKLYCSCQLYSHECHLDNEHKCICLCPLSTQFSHSSYTGLCQYDNQCHLCYCNCERKYLEKHSIDSFTKYCKCGYTTLTGGSGNASSN